MKAQPDSESNPGPQNSPCFITIEGIEGVGKSSNVDFISRTLREAGQSCVVTREPGGTPLAEVIRGVLLERREEEVDGLTELLLMFASRAQHIARVINPALEAGMTVVCDRFTDATYAYQGGGRGMDPARIAQLEALTQGTMRPTLTFLLDLDPETALNRAARRGELDRFEEEKLEFFRRVRESYLQRARQEPERCVIIDASLPLDQVQQAICQQLKWRCGLNHGSVTPVGKGLSPHEL